VVNELGDPSPDGRGRSLVKLASAATDVYGLIKKNFGK
jgi:hypothetical protein